MPWLIVNHTRLSAESAVPTPSLSLDVQRGVMPGHPGASFTHVSLVIECTDHGGSLADGKTGRPCRGAAQACCRSMRECPTIDTECNEPGTNPWPTPWNSGAIRGPRS